MVFMLCYNFCIMRLGRQRSSSFLSYDYEESYLLCLEREKLCFGRLVKFSFTITVERDEVALLNFLYTGEKQDNKEHFQWKLKIPY